VEEKAKADVLTFGTGNSSLGKFLAASSDKGIRAILFGDTKDVLFEELRREFPEATCVGGGDEYGSVIGAVGYLIEHPESEFQLPLDTVGGDFEQLTRAAIKTICAGKTVSHAEVARMIDASSESARYVADVCAKNPIAVAVPCHRVEDANGVGPQYRWGERIRRALLQREKTEFDGLKTEGAFGTADIDELARRRFENDRRYWDPGYAKSKSEGVPQRDVASGPEGAPQHDPEWLWSTIRNAARGG
jgi:O-6-methylguanine DNA methyltransferase